MYKLGIKRRVFPGYKWFLVVNHFTDHIADGARLVLKFPDGTTRAIPQIHKREVFVYPEYTAQPPNPAGPALE